MSRTLTPCLPRKSCVICESRLYPKAASPEKKAAKLAHQAREYGRWTAQAIEGGHADEAAEYAVLAFGFARLALDMDISALRAA